MPLLLFAIVQKQKRNERTVAAFLNLSLAISKLLQFEFKKAAGFIKCVNEINSLPMFNV